MCVSGGRIAIGKQAGPLDARISVRSRNIPRISGTRHKASSDRQKVNPDSMHGADAVVVSDHGGRQVDGAPGTLEVLPGIVDAACGDVEIILDGGIRRGADIATATVSADEPADRDVVGAPAWATLVTASYSRMSSVATSVT